MADEKIKEENERKVESEITEEDSFDVLEEISEETLLVQDDTKIETAEGEIELSKDIAEEKLKEVMSLQRPQ